MLSLGFATRALTNTSLRRLFGFGGRRAVDVHKTITVEAPVAEVYDFWSHVENFPRFMSHFKEVRALSGGRSHWVAVGPGGSSIEWEATITEALPVEVLAWKSVPGSAVPNAGRVTFRPTRRGGTQLDIHVSYNPPAGAFDHVIASLFGTDPKHAMDEDLARLKSLFVHGKTTAHGEQVTTEDVESRRRGPRAA